MLNVWGQKSGYNLGTYEENVPLSISLPIISGLQGVTYKIITGKLPDGLRLEQNIVIGTPKEVVKPTTYTFCVRASKNNDISDRTFHIIIEGADQPVYITEPDLLPVGPNQTYFVLDKSPIEFQITAQDFDTAAGQELRYFISSGDGTIPPGLTLEPNGRLHGLIDPLLAVFVNDRTGGFDTVSYDLYGYDYGIISDSGFDSFNYDVITYDYNAPLRTPKKLNRNYEFIVTATDGDSTPIKRKFRIYVVGEDFLKADNTLIRSGTNFYRADNSELRKPIWITPSNIGRIRANNFYVIKLDIVEMIALGTVQYYLEPKIDPNNVNSADSKLPNGMKLDIKTGEIYGIIPYQSESIKHFTFTVTATRFGRKNELASVSKTFTVSTLGDIDSKITWLTNANLGVLDVNLISTLKIEAISTLANAQLSYELISGVLPPGLTLQVNGEIIGKIRQYSTPGPDNIEGNTDDLKGLTTFYDIVNGVRVNNLTFDNSTTTVDKIYRFVIRAKDQANYSAIDQEFILEIGTPDNKLFSNLYVTTYMASNKRDYFNSFINNDKIFPLDKVYRSNDINFGVRKDLRMLIYAGIETRDAEEYISMIGLNHKRKRFRFGDVKKAKAKILGTNNIVYELVYVEMIDNIDFKDERLPLNLTIDSFNKQNLDLKLRLSKANNNIQADASNFIWKSDGQNIYTVEREPFAKRPLENITIDRTDLQVSDFRSPNRYPNSYTNWRKRIRSFKDSNGNTIGNQPKYLPLWMRSFQDNRQELGFTLAIPLCYCKPGMGDDILLNIKNSNFDFKMLDYTVDRYIIDSVNGYGADKFLVFKNKEVVI
jgi:hypothetical protein